MSKSDNTKNPEGSSLLAAAASAVPNSAKFDLEKDEIVKQALSVPLIKVLPDSPTVARLFEHQTVRLLRIKRRSREVIYPCDDLPHITSPVTCPT